MKPAQIVFGALVVTLLLPGAWSSWQDLSKRRAVQELIDVHRALAATAMAEGDYERAAVALESARSLAPTDTELELAVMEAAVMRAAERPHSISDGETVALDHAIHVLRQQRGSDTPGALVAAGHLALRAGDADEAKARYEAAIAAAPDYAHAHLALAQLHRMAGRSLEALASFEAAQRAAPGNITALNNLGVQYVDLGRTEDGIAMFQKAVEARDNAASRLNLGNAMATLERSGEALEHTRRAVELAPQSAEALRRLGGLLQAAGDVQDAEAALLRSLEIEQHGDTALAIARMYIGQERYDDAAAVLDKLAQANPRSPEVAYLIGLVLHRQGRMGQAVGAFKRYLSVAKSVPQEKERVAEVKAAVAQLTGPAPAQPQAPAPTPESAVAP